MVKDCRVMLNNDAVTVVQFGEVEVQLPAIHRDVNIVKVAFEDGKYKVVGEDYKEANAVVEEVIEDEPAVEEEPEKEEEKITTEEKVEKEKPYKNKNKFYRSR